MSDLALKVAKLVKISRWLMSNRGKLSLGSRLLWWVSARFLLSWFQWELIGWKQDVPYLLRIYLWRGKGPHVYLHHFFKSDYDPDLHNHPWAKALSLILTGGYTEWKARKTPVPHSISSVKYGPPVKVSRVLRPGRFNYITHDTFHRVDLLSVGCWTLFFTWGRKPEDRDKAWGFWDPLTDSYEVHSVRERVR